jgi:ketosteroid isomerase-like protein
MGERAERNAALLREGYAAFGSGDLATVQAMFSPDAVWHTPENHGQLSGDHKGWDKIAEFFMKTMELSEGTFRIEVLDIMASDEFVAGYVHVTGSARGRMLDDSPVHLYRIDDEGIVVEITQYPLNQSNVDEFWS